MRLSILILMLVAFTLAGCATQGPGASCDVPQAVAAPVGPGSQAAAAAATGGQRNNQAPFADDTARLAPKTTVGNGQGATTQTSADQERRHVASGGAQNLSVVTPNTADAQNLGGSSPAIMEAAKTVGSYRAMLQCELTKPYPDQARIEFLSSMLMKSQEALATAQASATVTRVTNNNFQNSRVQQFGISTSATNKDGETIDPDVVEPMARAAATLGTEGLVEYEESPTPVPEVDDSLPEPAPVVEPAPVAPAPGG